MMARLQADRSLRIGAPMRKMALLAAFALVGATLSGGMLAGCGDDPGAGGDDAGAASSSGGEDGQIGGLGDGEGLGTDTAASSGGDADAGVSSSSGAGDDGGGGDADDAGGSDDAADSVSADAVELDCPGGAGCKCDKNSDCDTAYCLDFPEGSQCAQLCTESCPKGLLCKDISGGKGDKVFACISPFVALCAPCLDDQLCQSTGVKGLCVDYGAEGRFCGGPCASDDECPTDYECIEAEGMNGVKAKQCKRKADAKNPLCGCSDYALAANAQTMCTKSNGVGTCKALRKCTAAGLAPCTAADAAPELCNALDDDCNGKVDDLDDEFKCSKKLFATLGSMATCTNDSDCAGKGKDGAIEKCDGSGKVGVGLCKQLEGECFGIPSCTPAGKLICNEAKTPIAENCDLQDNDCDGKTDETFAWVGPDGKEIAMGQPCGFGECGGGNVTCGSIKAAICDTQSKSSAEKCDGLDNDCDGETDDKGVVCDDGNKCTADECDGKSGTCANPASVDCDDKNLCTADSCDTKTGVCKNTLSDGASCDDGDACSIGDTCGKGVGGAAACLPGKATKVCDDANLCTDDACDAAKGCVGLANSATQACYTGPAKTENIGLCTGGTKLCKDGALLGACVGEVTPNNTEICDAKDDDCNGVVDNGCVANIMQMRIATSAGTVTAGAKGKHQLRLRMGGESAVHGVAVGNKTTGHFGWYAWLVSLTNK